LHEVDDSYRDDVGYRQDDEEYWLPEKGSCTEKVYGIAKAFHMEPDLIPLLNDMVKDCAIPETRQSKNMSE
jgi:hypothetical protein